jgi:hypothetical protein
VANSLALSFRSALLTADIDPIADNIKVVVVDNTYTFNTAHDNLDDVGAGTRIATSGNLANKTSTDGYFNSDDVTLSALPAGDTIVGLWVYKDSGAEATSKLMAWYDTNAAAAAISVATNGGDVVISPSNSPAGWFRV